MLRRSSFTRVVSLTIAVVFVLGIAGAMEGRPHRHPARVDAVPRAVARVLPAVVRITTVSEVRDDNGQALTIQTVIR